MNTPLSTSLVILFSISFLTGIFGGFLAPQPYNMAAMVVGTFSFFLLLLIGRRVDQQPAQKRFPAKQWRAVIRTMEVLLTAMIGLALWSCISFVRYRHIDVSLVIQILFAFVIMVSLRRSAMKHMHKAYSEENG